MKKILKVCGLVILFVALAYEFTLFAMAGFDLNYFKIDRCFDHGGCWDKTDRVCRQNEPNAQELCNR